MSAQESSLDPAQGPDTGANDLVKAVDQLLNEMGPKFSKVSSEIFERMDEMSRRLDEMESAIQAGNETKNNGT